MATLLELSATGTIVRYKTEPARAQDERLIYFYPQVVERIENEIAALESFFGVEVSPIEELDAFLERYCQGEPLTHERQFKCLTHLGDGIWELKTRDVRMFGWFARRDCFVCSAVFDATKTKDMKLYRPFCQEAVRRRDELELDEPKFIAGDDPNVVLSNFTYPAP